MKPFNKRKSNINQLVFHLMDIDQSNLFLKAHF